MQSKLLNNRADKKQKYRSALHPVAIAVRAGIVGLLTAHGTAQAATIEVDSHLDDGTDCTLREAMLSMTSQSLQSGCVNTSADNFNVNDTIVFAETLANSTITLNGTALSLGFFSYGAIQRTVAIDASAINRISVDANHQSGVFRLGQSIVSIDNLTITGGSTSGFGGGIFVSNSSISLNNSSVVGNYATNSGGGIRSSVVTSISLNNSLLDNNSSASSGGGVDAGGSLTIVNSTVSNNTAGASGGGIVAHNLTNITSSTVSNNSADNGNGGGVFFQSASPTSMLNSTVTGNYASNNGGGISTTSSTLSLNNSTIFDNTAGNISGADGLFAFFDSSVNLSNSIIAGSLDSDCTDASSSTVSSDTASIVTIDECSTSARNIDPKLDLLSDNGGDTLTHALRVISPARNTGDIVTCELNDQRGDLRDNGDGQCDVGAVEYNPNDGASFMVIPLNGGKAVVIPN